MSAYEKLEPWFSEHEEWEGWKDLIIAPPTPEELVEKWPDADQEVVRWCYKAIDEKVSCGAQYWRMREQGSSDSFAAMIALQKGPGLNTDDVFFQGQKPLYDQFGSQKHLNRYLDQAAKRGFRPSPQATYFPGLARFQGDPEAFVTRAQGRSYIKKLIEKRGGTMDRSGNVEWREPESDPLAPENCKPLGEDIIAQQAHKQVKANPDLARMDRKKLREKIVREHGPSK